MFSLKMMSSFSMLWHMRIFIIECYRYFLGSWFFSVVFHLFCYGLLFKSEWVCVFVVLVIYASTGRRCCLLFYQNIHRVSRLYIFKKTKSVIFNCTHSFLHWTCNTKRPPPPPQQTSFQSTTIITYILKQRWRTGLELN